MAQQIRPYLHWLNSYKHAVDWINDNATRNAILLVINGDSNNLLDFYDIRKDIIKDSIKGLNLPHNAYILDPHLKDWPNMKHVPWNKLKEVIRKLDVVYQVKRQDGRILTIYYNK